MEYEWSDFDPFLWRTFGTRLQINIKHQRSIASNFLEIIGFTFFTFILKSELSHLPHPRHTFHELRARNYKYLVINYDCMTF